MCAWVADWWHAAQKSGKPCSGCPICTMGGKPMCACKSLATMYPEIAADWDYERNADLMAPDGVSKLTPDTCSPYSEQKVWWFHTCPHGNEFYWQLQVHYRTTGGRDQRPSYRFLRCGEKPRTVKWKKAGDTVANACKFCKNRPKAAK